MVAIAAFGLMSITSCGDNGDDPIIPAGTTCQVTNNATPVTSTVGADGTMYEAKVIFYTADAEISETAIGQLATSGGMSEIQTAPTNATRVRVAFKLSPTTNVEYTVEYFALTAEALNSISITDQTLLTSTKGDMKGATMTFSEALAQL